MEVSRLKSHQAIRDSSLVSSQSGMKIKVISMRAHLPVGENVRKCISEWAARERQSKGAMLFFQTNASV